MQEHAATNIKNHATPRLARIGLGILVSCILAAFGAPSPSNAAPSVTDFPPTPSMTASSTVVTLVPTLTATLTPSPTFSFTPTLDPRGPALEVMADLQAAGLAPPGGYPMFTVPNGYALTSDPGYSFLPLGNGRTSRDFVLGFQLGWHWTGPQSACGIRFRGQSADWRSVMLTADDRLMLTHLTDGALTVNYNEPAVHFSVKSLRNPILLIAVGNTFSLYLDGQPEAVVTDDTTAADSAASGEFAFEVYNPANNTAVTSCAYYNVWVWSLDEHQSLTPTS